MRVFKDIVVHVRDISHPNTVAQKVNVLQTLSRMLSQQQMSSMIEVCNKVDRFDDQLPNRLCNSTFILVMLVFVSQLLVFIFLQFLC